MRIVTIKRANAMRREVNAYLIRPYIAMPTQLTVQKILFGRYNFFLRKVDLLLLIFLAIKNKG